MTLFLLTDRPSAVTRPCPTCHGPLTLGPVIFWCAACQRGVHGSLIDHEYRSAA